MIASSTIQNTTKEQAFTAGFREGVKLTSSLENIDGVKKFYLNTWCSIGMDVINGFWAMYGARLGALKSLYDIDFVESSINDLDHLYELSNSFPDAST